MPVSAPFGREARIAAFNRTLVKQIQMNVLEMLLQLEMVGKFVPAFDTTVGIFFVNRYVAEQEGVLL